MKFTSALVGLLLPVLAVAQYGPPSTPDAPASSSAVSSSSGAIPSAGPSTSTAVNVDVAADGQFVFKPSNFTASNGTTVTFFFPNQGLAHSVTQSNFSAPCTPLQASGQHGFDSGLQVGVQYTITITNDQMPIWFFCKQAGHCGLGMVGSINAPQQGNTYDAFKSNALAIGGSEPLIQDNGPVTGGVNAQATATPANTASAPGSSSGAGSSGSSSSSSDATRIVSGAFGLVALTAAALFA